jgi:hypothetical protein
MDLDRDIANKGTDWNSDKETLYNTSASALYNPKSGTLTKQKSPKTSLNADLDRIERFYLFIEKGQCPRSKQ